MDTVEEAADYDSMDHSVVNQVFAEDLLKALNDYGVEADGCQPAVDLGTGTALIPLEAARQGLSIPVMAVDLAAEMLRLAARNIRAAGLERSILPCYCDAKQLPLAESSCRIVMSNSIVHHIPNPRTVFSEVRRILAPGGVLFFRDLLRPETADTVEFLVESYAGDENDHQRQMFRQSLHAALTVGEVRDLLEATGLEFCTVEQTSDRHWTARGQVPGRQTATGRC